MSPDVSHVAVIYCRVSSDKQERETASLATQEADCRALCATVGLAIGAVYTEAHTGIEVDRPVFQTALEMIRAHRAGVVVIWKLDRFARDQDGQIYTLYQIEKKWGGRVLSVTDKLDDSPQGKFLRNALGFVAERERLGIILRTQRGTRNRAESGKPLTNVHPPYGYVWNEDKTAFVIDPVTAPIVRRIFTKVAQGSTIRAVRMGLDRDGIPTPSQLLETATRRHISEHWPHQTILHIIENPAYKGQAQAYRWQTDKRHEIDQATGVVKTTRTTTYRDEAVRIALPASAVRAIVTPSEWQTANSQIATNKAERVAKRKHHHVALLRAGLAVCGYCGRKAIVKPIGGHPPVYICSGQKDAPYAQCTGHYPSSSVHLVDDDVWVKVVQILRTDALMLAIGYRHARNDDTSAEDYLQEKLDSYTGFIADLQKRLRNLIAAQARIAETDSELAAEYDVLIKEATDQIARLGLEQTALTDSMDDVRDNQIARKVFAIFPDMSTILNLRLEGVGPNPKEPLNKGIADLRGTWAEMVGEIEQEFGYEDKRAILKWLGTRVEILKLRDKVPDGTHWRLSFSLGGLNDSLRTMAQNYGTSGTDNVSL
jgi:site-specific DNA recombinase